MKFILVLIGLLNFIPTNADASELDTFNIDSASLKHTILPLDSKRHVTVYLPDGYTQSDHKYPVIYYFHSFFWSDKQMFQDGVVKDLLDRSIKSGRIQPFILVAADFSDQRIGSFYGNSEVSGRWLDFIIQELVPTIDERYRTLPDRRSRVAAGEMIGGYAAIKLAMLYPQHFGHVYALHPVGTGTGLSPMSERPDWQVIHQASSFDEVTDAGNIFSTVFTAMAQAYAPNPNKPPLFADFMQEEVDGKLVKNQVTIQHLQQAFLLDRLLHKHHAQLRQVESLMFDWGRYDPNYDHIHANRAFTLLLDEYGIEHSAEEYRGNTYDQNWVPGGRVEGNMLPFLNAHLRFSK
jgi:pimeloyl-ACP methyl ester carboxylesterase